MQIKLIDYGYKKAPTRAHYNDAGADVHSTHDYLIKPHETVKIPLGFGVKLPDGFAAYVFPRSGLASKGIICEIPPIDSGYTGEIHAIVHNGSDNEYQIYEGDRIGQIVITPVILATFSDEVFEERGATGFGASGK